MGFGSRAESGWSCHLGALVMPSRVAAYGHLRCISGQEIPVRRCAAGDDKVVSLRGWAWQGRRNAALGRPFL